MAGVAGRRSKSGNGEGGIRYRVDLDRYEARLTLEDGRRRSLYGRNRQEVAAKLAEALRDRAHGVPIMGERATLGPYLEGWLTAKKHRIKPRSWRRYEEITRRHIVPTLGKVSLKRLCPQDLERLYSAKQDQGLSPTTVRYIHVTLRAALADAEKHGTVARNVARLVKPPRPAREEMHVLDSDQVRSLLAAADGSRLEALYVLAVHTGARLGELLALRWKDVSLDRASLSIQATLQKTREGFTFAPPKSAKSRRQIRLTPTAVSALKRHRVRQAEERLALGEAWQDQGLVFPDPIGGPMSGITVLRAHFRPLLRRAGLPAIRFHDLRHTCATLLLGRGVNPKIVSEMLGHSTVAITLDLYSHVLPTMQEAAAGALEAALGNG
jgi:integrase